MRVRLFLRVSRLHTITLVLIDCVFLYTARDVVSIFAFLVYRICRLPCWSSYVSSEAVILTDLYTHVGPHLLVQRP